MTSEATELVIALFRRGIELAPHGRDGLRYRPRGAVDDGLRQQLRHHKATLLSIVQRMTAEALPANLWARCASALLSNIEDPERRARHRELFEERAAVHEFDGQLSRDDAERLAFLRLRAALLGTTAAVVDGGPVERRSTDGGPRP